MYVMVFEFLFCLLEPVYAYMFYSDTLGRKKNANRYAYIVGIILIAGITFGLSNVVLVSLAKTAFYFCMIAAYSLLFGKGIRQKVFFSLVFIVAQILTEVIVFNLLSFEFEMSEMVYNLTNYRIVACVIIKIVSLIIFKSIGSLFKKDIDAIPHKYWILVFGIFTASLVLLIALFETNLLLANTTYTIPFLIIVACILLINAAIFIMFISLNNHFMNSQKMKMEATYHEANHKYYEVQKTAYNRTQTLWHDFTNHMTCLSTLLKCQNYEEAAKYIDRILVEAHNIPNTVKTGNEVIDIVVNSKKPEAEKHGISFTVKSVAPPNINMPAVDLCAILFNSIDNAIEACEKIPEKDKREINLTIFPKNEYLYLKLDNTFCDNNALDFEMLRSSKADSENHGFGISIIKGILEKHGGWHDMKTDTGVFAVTMAIRIYN